MRARIKDYIRTLERTAILTLETSEDVGGLVDELQDADLDVEVKKHREKRSLDANAYAWVLIGKLAEKLEDDPINIYRQYVRQSGVFRVTDLEEKDIPTITHAWSLNGAGWLHDVLDYGKHEDTRLVRLYYGSSVYNTKQMSRLIDSIAEDCKAQAPEARESQSEPDDFQVIPTDQDLPF